MANKRPPYQVQSRIESFYPLNSFPLISSKLLFSNGDKAFKPLVSFVVPTYRRIATFRKCISSIGNVIPGISFEVVVVDNTSNADPSYYQQMISIIREQNILNVRYFVNESNIGAYGNWNRGISLAKGVWIALVADDDFVHPFFLEAFRPFLEKSSSLNVGFLASELFFIGGDGNEIQKKSASFLSSKKTLEGSSFRFLDAKDYYRVNIPDILGSLVKKECFFIVGGFPEHGSYIEDWFFNTKLVLKCGGILINDRVYGCCNYPFSDSSRDEIWTSAKIDAFYFRVELKKRLNLKGFKYSGFFQKASLINEVLIFENIGKKRHLDKKTLFRATNTSWFLYFLLYFPLLFRQKILFFFSQKNLKKGSFA